MNIDFDTLPIGSRLVVTNRIPDHRWPEDALFIGHGRNGKLRVRYAMHGSVLWRNAGSTDGWTVAVKSIERAAVQRVLSYA